MMFFARVLPGSDPVAYPLIGPLIIEPRSWLFASYRQGACAIGYTRDDAIQRAKRRLEMPRPKLAPRPQPKGPSNHVLRLPAVAAVG